MLKAKYFEAEEMEYRDYFEENKEERQKFEDWLWKTRYEELLQRYHSVLTQADRCKREIRGWKYTLEREEDFTEKFRLAKEIERLIEEHSDCQEEITFLEDKIKKYREGDRVE